MLTSPTADLKLIYTPDPTTGGIMVDFALQPNGDLALVAGADRLAQDITRWLLTPQGSYPFDPTYGNPLLNQLLQPVASDPSTYTAMLQTAEAAFIAEQAVAAAQGYLSLDEQVASFGPPTITIGDGATLGQVSVSFTVYTRAGTSAQAFAPFSALLA